MAVAPGPGSQGGLVPVRSPVPGEGL